MIFGEEQHPALSLLQRGESAEAVKRDTGATAAVIDASFSIREGEIFVVMGLSGSGKSTLVRMINGLIRPTTGTLEVNGADVTRMGYDDLVELRRKTVAMGFQSFALLPHFNVRENVAFGLKIAGMASEEREAIAEDTLAHVGLEGYGDSYPDELSGGQQQRVGLARALAVDPDILLMDEAFSALDPLIRAEMQDELLALQEKRKRTVIFISHDLDEAFRIGDRIAVLQAGRVAQIGTPVEILMQPANRYVRAFFRNVDVTQVYTAGHVAHRPAAIMTEREGFGVSNAIALMEGHDTWYGIVTDRGGRYRGMVEMTELIEAAGTGFEAPLSSAFVSVETVHPDTLLHDLLGRVGESPRPIPVVADDGHFMGVLDQAQLLLTLDRTEVPA